MQYLPPQAFTVLGTLVSTVAIQIHFLASQPLKNIGSARPVLIGTLGPVLSTVFTGCYWLNKFVLAGIYMLGRTRKASA